jgi:hypothetical protein
MWWGSVEPYLLRCKGRHFLAAIKQPGGWVIERKHFGALEKPPQTLTTKLEGLPVVFSTLELAALVAESELMVFANLKWATRGVGETHTMSS